MSGGALNGGDWKIFDLVNGKCAVNGMEGKLRCWGAWAVRLSADNSLMAVGGNYNNFFLVEAKTGNLVWDLTKEGHVGVIHNLYFTPDNKYLISTAGNMMIRVWDIENKKSQAVFRLTSTNPMFNQLRDPLDNERAKMRYNVEGKFKAIESCAMSPDGKMLAIGGNLEGKVPLLDIASGKIGKTIDIKQPIANSVEFSPDGKWLLVSGRDPKSDDGAIEIWDIEKNSLVKALGVRGRPVISPDKKTLAASGSDGFRVWDVTTGKQKFSYFTKEDPRLPKIKIFGDGSMAVEKECDNGAVAFLPDGQTFLIVPHWRSSSAEVYFHDTATGEPVDFRKRVAALPK